MAIKLNNGYALAYFGRGITECNAGKKEAGCMDLQNAIFCLVLLIFSNALY